MLAKLTYGMDRDHFDNHVISLLAPGPVADAIRAADVPVHSLAMWRGMPNPLALLRLSRLLRRLAPHLVQTWLYHADLLATLCPSGERRWALLWNLRCAVINLGRHSPRTALVRRALVRLSGRPDAIIANSDSGKIAHQAIGYAPRRWEVIPNGFDTLRFRPDPVARREVREGLGIGEDRVVICLPARWDPAKDHNTFVRAAAVVAARRGDVTFLLAGDGLEPGAPQIRRLLARYPVAVPVHLLGRRSDMPRIYAASDIVTLTSAFSEAFPNVLGEAMACGVPCVATQIGDTASIVGDTGAIVAPGDPGALVDAWEALVDAGSVRRRERGEAARRRVQEHYSLARVVSRYQGLYRELADARAS